MAKTIGIISIKGGVGKTSVVSALGASLANDFGKKVLLVDGNFSAPNLGLQLGLVNPDTTLHHVLDNKISAKDAVYSTEYGFDVLPGALVYSNSKLDYLRLAEKLRDLRRKYDFILIDSSPNLNNEVLAAMLASDELLVVTTPDHVTLGTTLRAVKLAKEKKTHITGIIINKNYRKDFELSPEEIEEASGVQVLAVIPHEVEVLKSLAECVPHTISGKSKKSASSVEYKKLAASLVGENFEERGLGALLERLAFWKKVPKHEINRAILKNDRLRNPFS